VNDRRSQLEAVVGPVSRETFDSLVELQNQLERWNQRINLISSSTEDNIWQRHIVDSAQLVTRRQSRNDWIDLGSGGGLPGLVVGIICREVANFKITLIDSNAKKTAFLQHITGLLRLPTQVRTGRVEGNLPDTDANTIISARALAPLASLLDLAYRPLSTGAIGLFHKGRDYRRELNESADRFEFDLLEHPSVGDRDSVILEISNVRRRP